MKKKIIIYTQANCRQSDKVRQLLNSKKVDFLEKEITHDVLLKREMIERSGGRSVTPQIFVEGNYINGLEELQNKISNLVESQAA
ncbi:MAG: Glutaredoxin [Candidatus Midichloriaceae bacterium]|jgi:glutaredoxin 3|nr:Glutaredoxin [Candidatus Midichloriaceae bacterium]